MSPIRQPRAARAWALFTPTGWIFTDSCRRRRSEVVSYADTDAAPGWDWERYRKRGFFIAKVEIIPLSARAQRDGQ